MTATETYVRHCPKCGSVRVHRSRRRGPLERVLASFGAAICRCHDCCGRQAWFGLSPIPIGNKDPRTNPVAALAALLMGVGISAALLWWMFTHLLPFTG
ncbi:MAG TPA: hypothetical protein VGR73_03830 [Bryobacteraceae bacterium]|nr:hypothetical protein [Bryobacteraceae bacterium]